MDEIGLVFHNSDGTYRIKEIPGIDLSCSPQTISQPGRGQCSRKQQTQPDYNHEFVRVWQITSPSVTPVLLPFSIPISVIITSSPTTLNMLAVID